MAFQPCKRSSSRCWTVRGEVTRNYTVAMKGGRGHWQILGPPGTMWRMMRIGRVHHQHDGGRRQCDGKENFRECGGTQQSKPLALASDKFKVVIPKNVRPWSISWCPVHQQLTQLAVPATKCGGAWQGRAHSEGADTPGARRGPRLVVGAVLIKI